MGSEWIIAPAQVAGVPLLALFALLIARPRSRIYALCVLIPSLILGVLSAIPSNDLAKAWIWFSIAFCFSVVILGLVAFMVSLIVHAIKHPQGDGEEL